MEVWHATSRKNLRKIYQSGYLRKGSYVTADSMKNLTAHRRVEVLCLDADKRGECACECNIQPFKLAVPSEGPLTYRECSQYQFTENLEIYNCSCSCEGRHDKKVAVGIFAGLAVLGGISWYIAHKKAEKRKNTQIRPTLVGRISWGSTS